MKVTDARPVRDVTVFFVTEFDAFGGLESLKSSVTDTRELGLDVTWIVSSV